MTHSVDEVHDGSENGYSASRHVPRRGPLEMALAGLSGAAARLGANTLAVLVLESESVEIAFRQIGGRELPLLSGPIPCTPEMRIALEESSGAAAAGTSVALFLSSALAPAADSFLLFPGRPPRTGMVMVFGFEGPEPACACLPVYLTDSLNLALLAAWSLKELDRVRKELRRANHSLAGRKLVERAKGILQSERGMTEQQAYEYLRRMSRERRITLSKLAENLLSVAHWP